MPEEVVAAGTSPLEAAIGAEALENYERALASLKDGERQAIVLHDVTENANAFAHM